MEKKSQKVTLNDMMTVSDRITKIWEFTFPDETFWAKPSLTLVLKDPKTEPYWAIAFDCPQCLVTRNKKDERLYPTGPDGFKFFGARYNSNTWADIEDFTSWLSQIEKQIMATVKFGQPA